jgi:unsaturated rhamnogalacturonyl hydrolase
MLLKRLLPFLATTHVAAAAFTKAPLNAAAKSAIQRLTAMADWNTGWDWDQGVGLYGIWKHYEATGDKASFAAVQDWFTTRLPRGQRKHVNSMSVFTTLADLYKVTRDPQWVPYLEEWGSWAMYNLTRTQEGGMQHVTSGSQNTQQLWIDTLMMAALPLAKIGVLLDRPEYVAEARKQFGIHIKYLHDKETGMFFHAWTFVERDNFAAAHWARGNAWAVITLTELLELLGADGGGEKQDPTLRGTLDAVLAALPRLQEDERNGGLWRTVLDRPITEGSYIETSASAGFLFSYAKAQRKGWLAGDKYASTVGIGMEGVLNSIAPSGEVRNVSAGTGVGETLQHYYDIPKVQTMWGQGMAVMALMEMWQALD